MDKRTFRLSPSNPKWRGALELAQSEAERRVKAGEDCEIEVREPKRSLAENALLHTLIDELSRKMDWAGERQSAEVWKRLLIAAWCRANGTGAKILPALDGHGVDIVPARSSKLSRKDCAELIEFVYAFGSDNGVKWSEHKEAW